jgi:capsid protein
MPIRGRSATTSRISIPGDYRFSGMRTWTFVPARGAETGSWRVLHVYRQMRAGQIRGVPMLATVMEQLKQLSRLSEAELMASVVNSLFTVFVKSESGDMPLPDMQTGQPGVAQNPPPPVSDDRALNLGSGLAVGLLPGEDIAVADPKRPNAQYDPFFEAIVDQIGAAIGFPGSVLLKRFDAELFRRARGAARVLARRADASQVARPRLCAPCREAVIEEAVARGLIDAPGFFTDPLARRSYCQATWTGPAMGQLNPLDESNAFAKNVAEGFMTIAEVTAQITGGDFDRNHTQRAKEHRMRVEAGLEPEVLGITTRAQVAEKRDADQTDPSAPGAEEIAEARAREDDSEPGQQRDRRPGEQRQGAPQSAADASPRQRRADAGHGDRRSAAPRQEGRHRMIDDDGRRRIEMTRRLA